MTARAPIAEMRQLSAASLVLELAVVGIEFGYLQAHRAGWNPASVRSAGSVAGTTALAVVGATILREPLSVRDGFGIVLCLAGLAILLSHAG
jgi:hypothetical protein